MLCRKTNNFFHRLTPIFAINRQNLRCITNYCKIVPSPIDDQPNGNQPTSKSSSSNRQCSTHQIPRLVLKPIPQAYFDSSFEDVKEAYKACFFTRVLQPPTYNIYVRTLADHAQ